MLRLVHLLGIAGVFTAVAAAAAPAPAWAGEADVISVTVAETGTRIYRFDVTVRHEDSGWKHFADRWEVLDPDGRVLATRKLLHPHEKEQPFTRSLSGVRVPRGIVSVTIRAHDSMHEYGGAEQMIDWRRSTSRTKRAVRHNDVIRF